MNPPRNLSGRPLYQWYQGKLKVVGLNEEFGECPGSYVAVYGEFEDRYRFAQPTNDRKNYSIGRGWQELDSSQLPSEFRATLLLLGVPT